MKMTIRKRVTAFGAVLALAVGGLAVAAPQAQAINRVDPCQGGYTWIYSDSTTCWGGLGTVNVVLYNVNFIDGGSNNGSVIANGVKVPFVNDRQSAGTVISPRATVTVVKIDSSI